MQDLTTDADSIQLIQDFWAAGKPVAAVCHGPTVFLNVMDTKTGEAFVKGKKVRLVFLRDRRHGLSSCKVWAPSDSRWLTS